MVSKGTGVKQRLSKGERLNTVEQNLDAVIHELNSKQAELSKVNQELAEVKHQLSICEAELSKANQEWLSKVNQLDEVIQELAIKQEELNTVSQRVDEVKHELTKAEELSKVSHTGAGRLSRVNQSGEVKQRLSIAGWNIQQDGHGYYRAFKKISGKLYGLYLGRSLKGAEERIQAREAEVRQRVNQSGHILP